MLTSLDEERSSRERPVADAVASFLSRHEPAVVLSLLGFYSLTALIAGRARELWFDELGTLLVARQPTLHRMFAAAPPDGQPPLYYLMARASMRLFGQNACALRLPALIAFLVAALCVYVFVRRRTAPLYGLLAAAALCASDAGWYSMDARPYSSLLAGTALAMVCWQSAASEDAEPWQRRLPALAGLSLGCAVAILAHAFGVFYVGLPLLAGEAVRFARRGRLDIPVCSACLAGLIALTVTVPAMHRSRVALFTEIGSRPLSQAPTVGALLAHFGLMAGSFPIVVVLLALLCLRAGKRPHVAGTWAKYHTAASQGNFGDGGEVTPGLRTIPRHEIAAAVALSALLLAAWIFCRLITHYYFSRYGVGMALGMAIATAWLVWILPFRQVLALALLIPSTASLLPPLVPALFGPYSAFGRAALIDQGDPRLPVVMASGVQLLPAWYYGSPALRQRLHYIADRHARDSLFNPLTEITIVGDAAHGSLPVPLDTLEDFLGAHRSFLLYATEEGRADEWLPAELHRRGYRLGMIASRIYDHLDALYLVTAPNP